MESIFRKTISWNDLTPSDQSYFSSQSVYYSSLINFCIEQQIAYQPIFEGISADDYYTKLFSKSIESLQIYPYHLICQLNTNNYISDMEYYAKITENCLMNITAFDNIPPFVALDIKRKLNIDKGKYEELIKESKSSGIWGYFKTKTPLTSKIMPADSDIVLNPEWNVKLIKLGNENTVVVSETYNKLKKSIDSIIGNFDQKELQSLYKKKLIYFYPNIRLSDCYYYNSIDSIINHKLNNNYTTKICIDILKSLLERSTSLETIFNKLNIDSDLGISLISLMLDNNIISNQKIVRNYKNINILTNSTQKTIDELIEYNCNLSCLKTVKNIDCIFNYEEITKESNTLKRIKFENEYKAMILCFPTSGSYKISKLPVFGPISYLYETPWFKLFIYSKCGVLPIWIYPKGTYFSTLPEEMFNYPYLKITKWADNKSEIISTNSAILKLNSYLPQTHLFIQALLNNDVQEYSFSKEKNIENSKYFLMDKTFGMYETIKVSEDKTTIIDIKYGIDENKRNDFDIQFIENENMCELARSQMELTDEFNTFVKILSSDKLIPIYPIYGNNRIITK